MTNEDYKAVLETVRKTLENCQRQNEALIDVVKYYADDQAWQSRDIPMLDRGYRARKILKEVAA